MDNDSQNIGVHFSSVAVIQSSLSTSVASSNFNSLNCTILEDQNITTAVRTECVKNLVTPLHQVNTDLEFPNSTDSTSSQTIGIERSLSTLDDVAGLASNTTESPILMPLDRDSTTSTSSLHNRNYSNKDDNIQALISNKAEEYSISSTTLFNLVKSESTLNPDAVGDKGCSVGLVQINLCAHPNVAKEDALDPEFALTYAAKAIASSTEYAWTSCNCWSYIKANYIHNLPGTKYLIPNSGPVVGGVVLFNYRGVKHYAYIESVSKNYVYISEANYTRCKIGERKISLYDPHIVGFWSA